MSTVKMDHEEVVAASSQVTVDYVPASGEDLTITGFCGSAGYARDTTVCLVWDAGEAGEVTIRSTHGSLVDSPGYEIEGDGTKILRIVLDNSSGDSLLMGGHVKMEPT